MSQDKIRLEIKLAITTIIRAYGLSWAITTLPGILSLLFKIAKSRDKINTIQKAILVSIPALLKKSLTKNGFPLLVALSFGGQRILRVVHEKTTGKKMKPKAAIFWSSIFGMWTVKRLYPAIRTLDLTFFVLVRALDVLVHRMYESSWVRRKVPQWMLEYGNIFVFMMASTEIIFSWFYEPHRLPKSYANWITNMSGVDGRILKALRVIRSGEWIYGKNTGLEYLLGDYCDKLEIPRTYGDPLSGRINCVVIHEGGLWGCEVNAMYRFAKGFIKIFPVYLAVHLTPPLIFKTSRLTKNPIGSLFHILAASVRSSTFLGTYIGIIWYCICLVRTRIGHQVLGINQTRLDDTLGPLTGSMLCGLSLLIENKHRRGEMALYVVPRALFSVTGRILSPLKKQRWWDLFGSKLAEDIVFATSLMVVINSLYKDKEMVRPSIRGLMSWVMKEELLCDKSTKKAIPRDAPDKKDDEEEKGLEIKIRRSLSA
ncbi:unnamed protein product [Rhizopus stolonifer]